MMADILVGDTTTTDTFWDLQAKQFLSGLLLYVWSSNPPALKNLTEIRYLLLQSQKDLAFTINGDEIGTWLIDGELTICADSGYNEASILRRAILNIELFNEELDSLLKKTTKG